MKTQTNFLHRLCLFVTLGLVLSTHASTAWAQSRDRASASYDHLGESKGVSARFYEINGNHRFFLDEDGASLLTAGVQYRDLYLDSENANLPQERDRRLQLLVPQFSLMQLLNDEYSLIITARPGFFGEWQGDFGRSFRFEGGALVSRVWSDKLTLGFGVARGSNFGRDLIVPLLQVLYLPTPTIMIDALLPVKAEAWYLPSRFWEFGAVFNIVGSLYMLDQTSFGAEELGFANMNLGLAVRRNLWGNLYATAEAGYTVSRRYEWSTDRDPQEEQKLGGVPYARAGFNFRF